MKFAVFIILICVIASISAELVVPMQTNWLRHDTKAETMLKLRSGAGKFSKKEYCLFSYFYFVTLLSC